MIAAGIDAIHGPFGDFRNDEGYLKHASNAPTLGAVAKWRIGPSQIALAWALPARPLNLFLEDLTVLL